MIILTDHFCERWRERVGGPVPAAGDVERMIRGAVVLQKFLKAYTPRGKPITILAIYWIPELAAVIKMDDKRRNAVTVITANLSREKEGTVVLQKFRKAYAPGGRPITILAIYWLPSRNEMIKMDDKRGQAVTVITADLSGEKEGNMCNAMCQKQKPLFFRCPDCGRRGKGGELLPPGDGEMRCPKCGGHRWKWE